jgi:hypothetical protein
MSKATGDSYATARAAYDEYYTHEDDVVSTPSSYRKIRRSKSMFSPRNGPHVFYANGSPDRTETSYIEQSTADSRTPQSQTQKAPLRAPKSMSFLRSRMSTGFRERNDEAVQMARDRFFRSATEQRLREQPSFFFKSRAPKREKSFRQSVRSSSANSYGMPVASANQPPSPKGSLKDKARKASKSIKNKLKRVLGFNKNEPVAIPNQQVDAQETHFQQFDCDVSGGQETFSDIPHPDEAALARVASRVPSSVPSIRITGSNEKLNAPCGSTRSLRSEQRDDKSRVSSWTDASVRTFEGDRKLTEEDKRILDFCRDHPDGVHGLRKFEQQVNAIAYEQAYEENVRFFSGRENQRLSIINENGTHVPSSSFNQSKVSNQLSAYPVIHRHPMGVPKMASVDSARVYSALMKRLEDNSPEKKLAAARLASLESTAAAKQSLESLATAKNIPERTSSVHSSRDTPTTIRQVPPSEATSSGKSLESAKHRQSVKPDIHAAKPDQRIGHAEAQAKQRASTKPIRQSLTKYEDDVFSICPITKQRTVVYQGKTYLAHTDTPSSKKPSTQHPSTQKPSSSPSSSGISRQDSDNSGKSSRKSAKRFSSKQLAQISALLDSKGISLPPQEIANFIDSMEATSPKNGDVSPSGSGLSRQGSDKSNNSGKSGKSFRKGEETLSRADFALLKAHGAGLKLTPQQLALLNEPVLPRPPQRMPPKVARKGLRESRSTFFAGGTTTIGRAASPFRLSMNDENSNPTALKREEYDQKLLTPNPLFRGHKNISDSPRSCNSGSEVVYSESVYSRSTGGRSYARNGSNLSLVPKSPCIPEVPLTNSPKGEAVIIERAVYRPTESGHRVTDSGGSGGSGGSTEWKKWMASEVARLVYSKLPEKKPKKGFVGYKLPTMPKPLFSSHVRESAQINDDDIKVTQQRADGVKQPLGLVQQNPNIQNPPVLKPILKNRSAVSLLENIEPANAGRPPIPPPPPPIPVRSPPRTVQSGASLRSVGTANSARPTSAPNSALKVTSMNGRNVLHKRNASNTTLRSTKSVETPAKLVKKHGGPLTSTTNTPIGIAVEKQFGATSTRSHVPGTQNENHKMVDENEDIYGIEGAGLFGPGNPLFGPANGEYSESYHQVGSFLKRMRSRVASDSESSHNSHGWTEFLKKG